MNQVSMIFQYKIIREIVISLKQEKILFKSQMNRHHPNNCNYLRLSKNKEKNDCSFYKQLKRLNKTELN